MKMTNLCLALLSSRFLVFKFEAEIMYFYCLIVSQHNYIMVCI